LLKLNTSTYFKMKTTDPLYMRQQDAYFEIPEVLFVYYGWSYNFNFLTNLFILL
jgi:hypothetical protein